MIRCLFLFYCICVRMFVVWGKGGMCVRACMCMTVRERAVFPCLAKRLAEGRIFGGKSERQCSVKSRLLLFFQDLSGREEFSLIAPRDLCQCGNGERIVLMLHR